METTSLRVGLLGCGHVGGALVRSARRRRATRIAARTGLRLELAAVAVRSLLAKRDGAVPAGLLTHRRRRRGRRPDRRRGRRGHRWDRAGPHADPRRALKAGKPVVTANKELLANCGAELFEAASTAGVDLLFEAAVAGGIPLIRPLRESLAGERIRRDHGHRQRHDQLHPHPHERVGDELPRRPGRGPEPRATPSEIPPPTSRGTTPRPRPPSWPTWPSGPGSWRATCTARGSAPSPPPTSPAARQLGYAVKLLAVIEHAERGAPDDGRHAESVAVRVHPAMVPVDPPAGDGAGLFQRRVHRGRCRRRAHVPRARGRRHADGQRRAGRPPRRRPQPDHRRGRPQRRPRAGARSGPSTTCASAVLPDAGGRRPARSAARRVRSARAASRCRSG